MQVRAIRQHRSKHGFHLPGEVYSEDQKDAEYKIERGIVEEMKAEVAAPENKAAKKASAKK